MLTLGVGIYVFDYGYGCAVFEDLREEGVAIMVGPEIAMKQSPGLRVRESMLQPETVPVARGRAAPMISAMRGMESVIGRAYASFLRKPKDLSASAATSRSSK